MKAFGLLFIIFITACTTTPQEVAVPVTIAPKKHKVAVYTNPPGCLIELDNQLIGISPCIVELPFEEGENFTYGAGNRLGANYIQATPPPEVWGLRTKKNFTPGPLPSSIFLDTQRP